MAFFSVLRLDTEYKRKVIETAVPNDDPKKEVDNIFPLTTRVIIARG